MLPLRSKLAVGTLLALVALLIAFRNRLRALQLEVNALTGSVLLLKQDVQELKSAAVPPPQLGAAAPTSPAGAPDSALHARADELYEAEQLEETHALLEEARKAGEALNVTDVEVRWRLARVCYDLAEARAAEEGVKLQDSAEARERLLEGLDHATAALAAGPRNFAAHKWYGAMLGSTAKLEGKKAQIETAEAVRQHFEMAIELNPNDATTHHLLGLWHFNVAGLSWTLRKLASVVFATPPTSTFEEAKVHFANAEKLMPRLCGMANKLMLAKCCIELKEKDAAADLLRTALSQPPNGKRTEDKALAECEKLLATL